MLHVVRSFAPAVVIAASALLAGHHCVAQQQGVRDKPAVEKTQPGASTYPIVPQDLGTNPKPIEQVKKPSTIKSGPPKASAPSKYHEFVRAAREAFLKTLEEYRGGLLSGDRVYRASRLLMEAQREDASTAEDRLKAVMQHLGRIRDLARGASERGQVEAAEANAFLAEAQLLAHLFDAGKADLPEPAPSAEKRARDPRTAAIIAKLEQPIDMQFPNETPLEDVLKYIKQATQGPNDAGIPIYVDPVGMQEAEKTLTSSISIDLKHVPLRISFRLLLKQLGLTYGVKDGYVMITSEDSIERLMEPDKTEPSPFLLKRNRFERGEMSLKELKEYAEELKLHREIQGRLDELNSHEERAEPATIGKPDQVENLVKQMNELISLLKSEREKSKPTPVK